MTRTFIALFLGGGIGSMMRYGVQMLMHQKITPYNFPWATLTVNIAGCFLIGLFYSLSNRLNLSNEFRTLLTAGLCGGFTTFSTFSNDTLELIRNGHWPMAAAYITLSVLLGLAAVFAGTSLINTTQP